MPFIEKAYILHTSNPSSLGYAQECAASCDQYGVPYEYLVGHEDLSLEDMEKQYGWTVEEGRYREEWHKEFMCTLGHVMFWQKVVDENKTCAILEHDAIVKTDLRRVNIHDGILTFLGYRVDSRDDYSVPKNPEFEQYYVNKFEGTHGYAVTPTTAKLLIERFNHVMPMPIDGMISIHNLADVERSIVIPNAIVGEVRQKSQTLAHGNPARYNTIPPTEWWDNVVNRSKYERARIAPGEIRIVF